MNKVKFSDEFFFSQTYIIFLRNYDRFWVNIGNLYNNGEGVQILKQAASMGNKIAQNIINK